MWTYCIYTNNWLSISFDRNRFLSKTFLSSWFRFSCVAVNHKSFDKSWSNLRMVFVFWKTEPWSRKFKDVETFVCRKVVYRIEIWKNVTADSDFDLKIWRRIFRSYRKTSVMTYFHVQVFVYWATSIQTNVSQSLKSPIKRAKLLYHDYWSICQQALLAPSDSDPQERYTMAQPAHKRLYEIVLACEFVSDIIS